MLNHLLKHGVAACEVTSDCDLSAPGKYEVTASRNRDSCCLEVRPVPKHAFEPHWQKPGKCSQLTCTYLQKHPHAASSQMKKVSSLVARSSHYASVTQVAQTEGRTTLSFKVVNLNFEALSCGPFEDFVQAIKEAISYSAGIGVKPASVTVAVKPIGKLRQANYSAQQCDNWNKRTSFIVVRPPWEHDSGDDGGQIKDRSNGSRASFHSSVLVQATLADCGSCQAAISKLSVDGVKETIQMRVNRVIGRGKGDDGVFGHVLDLQVPANLTSCFRFVCPKYMVSRNPLKVCFGGHCPDTCCTPIKCAQVQCAAPLEHNNETLTKKCRNETECANTCCLIPCKSYECKVNSSCPRVGAWKISAPPALAEASCCRLTFPPCCSAPIAWCVACKQCKDVDVYCAIQLSRWLLPDDVDHHDDHLGSPLLLAGTPDVDDQERWGDDQVEQRSLRPGRALWSSDDDAMLSSLPALNSSEDSPPPQAQNARQQELLASMNDEVAKAAAFHAASKNKVVLIADTSTFDDAEKQRWQAAIEKAMYSGHKWVAGCEIVATECCDYKLESVFLLHRGYGLMPLRVNTVQVLTDTMHAVSCGDDSLCWVWRIRDGEPTQVFPDHSGPVLSVAVLKDATYILSVGLRCPKPEQKDCGGVIGEAFIWDWRWGFRARLLLQDHPVLAAGELDAWRMVLLGNVDGFTTAWQWFNGNTLKLPYNSRKVDEIRGFARAKAEEAVDGFDGWKRLAIKEAVDKGEAAARLVLAANPKLVTTATALALAWDISVWNDFGAVKAIAYVPTNLRFVTAHGDGRVRYWDARSGTLLMTMRGHVGSVNAVAALPTRQAAISGGDDGMARLWDLNSGKQLKLFYQPYGGPVLSLAVIPGGIKVAVGSSDGFVRIWNIKSGELECALNTYGGAVQGLAVNPSNPLGQLLAAGADGYVHVFNPHHHH